MARHSLRYRSRPKKIQPGQSFWVCLDNHLDYWYPSHSRVYFQYKNGSFYEKQDRMDNSVKPDAEIVSIQNLSFSRGDRKKFNDIYLYLNNKLQVQQKEYVYTLNFLYLLGKLKYDQETDILRYEK